MSNDCDYTRLLFSVQYDRKTLNWSPGAWSHLTDQFSCHEHFPCRKKTTHIRTSSIGKGVLLIVHQIIEWISRSQELAQEVLPLSQTQLSRRLQRRIHSSSTSSSSASSLSAAAPSHVGTAHLASMPTLFHQGKRALLQPYSTEQEGASNLEIAKTHIAYSKPAYVYASINSLHLLHRREYKHVLLQISGISHSPRFFLRAPAPCRHSQACPPVHLRFAISLPGDYHRKQTR